MAGLVWSLDEGPSMREWTDFQGTGPWGDAGVGLADGQVRCVRVPFGHCEAVARASGLSVLDAGEWDVEVPMALVAADPAEIPLLSSLPP